MHQSQIDDWLNPNLGWVIGPIAMATAWVEAKMPAVDLSWAELLYSVAAVLYAIAAVIKTLRDKQQSKAGQKSTFTTTTADTQDTIDIH
jgi:hypothetical protein